jgi:signal peptidase I
MEPNIHAGSLVVINPQKDYTDIKERDIIVYNRKSDNTLIIHRVVEITDDAIRTKGDANQSIDDINVTPDIYVGKYIFGIPKAGKIFDFFESKQNKAIYIIILLGICIIDVYLDKPAKKRKN